MNSIDQTTNITVTRRQVSISEEISKMTEGAPSGTDFEGFEEVRIGFFNAPLGFLVHWSREDYKYGTPQVSAYYRTRTGEFAPAIETDDPKIATAKIVDEFLRHN